MTSRVVRTCDGCDADLPKPDGSPGLELHLVVDLRSSLPAIDVRLDACNGAHAIAALADRLGADEETVFRLRSVLGARRG